MEQLETTDFNGPIPGSSLTHELGSQPDERPPMFAEPADAYDYLVDKISNEDAFKRIVLSAELGIPVELTVRSIVYAGWAQGFFTLDTMYLIYGPLFEIVMKMLDRIGVEYIPLATRKQDQNLEEAYNLLDELKGKTEEPEEEPEEPEEPEESEEESIPTSGLMGRSE
jgi:hypothetical protein